DRPVLFTHVWVDVEREQLAQLFVQVLRSVLGIATRAAVAHANVEPTVRPERELAAVVVRVRLVDEEKLAPLDGGRISGLVLDDACVAVRVRVIDVEEPRRLVLRFEGDREQPPLAATPPTV